MTTVGQTEIHTQTRVINLLQGELHYDYLGNWKHRPGNSHIEEEYLRPFLQRRAVAPALIERAIEQLKKVAGDQSRGLYEVNKNVYGLLRYGVQVRADVAEQTQTVQLIDWANPQNNHFALAEEVTIAGEHTKRPDIVLYVNGIALAVLELKRSTVSVSEGIRQNLDNQQQTFIRPFFATVQLIMAGNDTQGLRYGVIETKETHYLTWKEQGDGGGQPAPANLLDRHLIQLCEKRRFLELIHDFMVFDAGTKKTCRPSQYFGVLAARERVRRNEGGIIWHTQGSGKSLVMVWLARWVREHIPDGRVLIITDRIELDEQIEKVFDGAGEQILRTKSGGELIDAVNAAGPWLICSLVHKFGSQDAGGDQNELTERDVEEYIADLQRRLPPGFSPKGRLVVYVDECHRTQSGKLHRAMKAILPGAIFIGFTGTPLLKADKQRSIEVFGSYIHTYRFDEAVRDGVILDLRYEARDIDQTITSQSSIDKWFAAKTQGLTEAARAQLKQHWGTMQRVLSSRSRLERIVDDILLDMATKDRLQSGYGNALLVSDSIYNACKLYELFANAGFTKCAIVTSYRPLPAAIKGETTGEGYTEKMRQYEIYRRMLAGYFQQPEEQAMYRVEEFEQEVKKKFVNEPGQMRLLIVVDKLLTGFDAPPATYLYIDKPMRDHGLFQAICRVNRLDSEDKEYGYIVDYRDLFMSLEASIHDYTSGALDGYDQQDVAGLLSNRLEKGAERLEEAREAVKALCAPVLPPQDTLAYQRYFCGDVSDKSALKESEPRRVALYKLVAALVRAYANLANEMVDAGYSPDEIAAIKAEVVHFEQVRAEIKLSSGDYIDLKAYEPAMRHLIDAYIQAGESKVISIFDDLTLVQLIVERGAAGLDDLPAGIKRDEEAVAETIENNLRKVITDEQPINPKYYERMSELLDILIRQRREQALAYEQYLAKIVELSRQVMNPAESRSYPASLETSAQRALYDNLDGDEQLALALDGEIRRTKKDDWRGNRIKEREILYLIQGRITDQAAAERIFELVKNQHEY